MPAAWDWTKTGSVTVPPNAAAVEVHFAFDPIDAYHNNYFGWLLDDVIVTCSEEIPTLGWDPDTPTSLPQGQEGEPKYVLNPSQTPSESGFNDWVTGPTDRRFWLAKPCDDPRCPYPCGCEPLDARDENPLPERVVLTEDGQLVGVVQDGEAGTYEFWVLVESGSEQGRDYSCICKKFVLAIRSPTGNACLIFDDFANWAHCWIPTPGANVDLWHEVNTSFTCVDLTDYGSAAFFGQDATCDYATGNRVKGAFCSPTIPIGEEYRGYELTLGFKSFRGVEDYAGGGYDKTWVQFGTDGGVTWQPEKPEDSPWYRDSGDPLEQRAWTWQDVGPTGVYIPSTGTYDVRVRFCFDSVDGYNNKDQTTADAFYGWLVDEVTVCWEPTVGEITTECPLPDGYIGENYQVELHHSGGPAGSPIWRAENPGLPDGLVITTDGAGKPVIKGTPRGPAGEFCFDLVLYMGQEEIDRKECCITIHDQRCFFFEDFEGDPDWAWTGLWNRASDVEIPAPPVAPVDIEAISIGDGNHVGYFGHPVPHAQQLTYRMVPDDRSQGELSLWKNPAGIDISTARYLELTFQSFRQVESFNKPYDKTKVQVRFDTSPVWYTVWYKDARNPSSTDWEDEIANKGIAFERPALATKMWIRFVFDSVDRWYNNYFGWAVDNVKVCLAQDGGPIAPDIEPMGVVGRLEERELSVMNVPNPVRDVHTTTFTVRGLDIEAMKIQIFDLNETLVFEQEIAGNELVWHTENNYGENLANGVYFYRAFAKIGGVWIATKFEKLVILR
jgi:hypothetical protein